MAESSAGALRGELERRLRDGICVYCRTPAKPDEPLTREHVIPRARGGRRRDSRILVPACARCNHRRGCRPIVSFLLARPRRISSLLEYFHSLPPDLVRQVDPRVFAELYAALWLLDESAAGDGSWRTRLRRLARGRRLHRRRHAARRIVSAVGDRLGRSRRRSPGAGPTCPLPSALGNGADVPFPAPLARGLARLAGTLSLMWGVPADRVLEELSRERERTRATARRAAVRRTEVLRQPAAGEMVTGATGEPDALDGWRRRPRRRTRVDRRAGRARRGESRGRAA